MNNKKQGEKKEGLYTRKKILKVMIHLKSKGMKKKQLNDGSNSHPILPPKKNQ